MNSGWDWKILCIQIDDCTPEWEKYNMKHNMQMMGEDCARRIKRAREIE